MTRVASLFAGVFTLLAVWTGPLPMLADGSFLAHMTMHMGVVAVAAPLLAFGLTKWLQTEGPITRYIVALPLAASLLELIVIWGWHAPKAHEAARTMPWVRAAEQGSFLLVSLLLWLTVLAGSKAPSRYLAGAAALLFTSMHMTLLGVLIGLMPNPICTTPRTLPLFGLDIMADQQTGGIFMLGVGGVVYLAAGLTLVGLALHSKTANTETAQ